MKKLITSLAVVLTATFIQAGSVNWNISGLDTAAINNTFSGTDLAGAIVYGFLGDSALASSAGTAAGNGTFATFLSGNPGAAFGTAITGGTGAAALIGAGTLGSSVTYDLFLVVFDAATYGAAGNYLVTNVKTQTTPGTGAAQTVSFTVAGGGYTALWTDVVPEPTSMALLALGAAAVGLRRRFKK